MMTDAQIEVELKALESRKAKLAKLAKLIALREEVSAMETSQMAGTKENLAMQIIRTEVCAKFGIREDMLHGSNRRDEVCIPRQVFFYLARELTSMSLRTAGRFLGKDHATVIYGCRSTTDRIETDGGFAQIVSGLEESCRQKLDAVP